MNGIMEFLHHVRPSGWFEIYKLAEKVADDSVDLNWRQRSQAMSEQLMQLIGEPFGPKGLTSALQDDRPSGWPDERERQALSRTAEETAMSGKVLVTTVLLQLDAKGCPVANPGTVEHALTLALSLFPAWGEAGQKLLERRDDECDLVLATLPGYMLTMLADDFAAGSDRQSRIRAIWTGQLLASKRSGAFSLAIH